jgi:molybdopterin-guanine dinucleotide biosynthesis protein A
MPVFPAALVDALVGDGGAVLAGQQLAGWWPASLADMLDDHLAHAQNRSIRGWMARAKAREVSMDGMAMPNINRPEDLALIGLHVAVLAAGAGGALAGASWTRIWRGGQWRLGRWARRRRWARRCMWWRAGCARLPCGPRGPHDQSRCGQRHGLFAAPCAGRGGGAGRLLVMLADMPCVSPDLLRALLAAGARRPVSIPMDAWAARLFRRR